MPQEPYALLNMPPEGSSAYLTHFIPILQPGALTNMQIMDFHRFTTHPIYNGSSLDNIPAVFSG